MSSSLKEGEFVGALDCGTTSTRFIIFDGVANIVAEYQAEFPQYYPHPGWHEHQPQELFDVVIECLDGAAKALEKAGWSKSSVRSIGITNQRETTVAWSKSTGKALCNAIVWDDARTKGTVRHYNRLLDENGLMLEDGTVKKGKEGRRYLMEL
ncbi:Glycerol kinase, partial [Tulasnella sp. 427]